MDYIDQLRAEITRILNPAEGETINIRRLTYLEGELNRAMNRYDI